MHFNAALPLFDKQRFFQRLDDQYSWSPDPNPAWWAALNVVLALAERRKAEFDPAGNSESRQISLGYVKNALNVLVDMFLGNTDLLSVQATLGLALYFQDTANPQPLFMFSSAALRMAQGIGMHRSAHFGLSESEVEERRNVFWIAFILDAGISLRTGRPPMQDASDYDIPLPLEYPPNKQGVLQLQGGTISVSFFSLLSRLALLQRRIYHLIYSLSALRRTRTDILKGVKSCEEALRAWRMSVPSPYHPGCDFDVPREPLLPYILRLHLAFHGCQTDLHRAIALSRISGDCADAESDAHLRDALSESQKESIAIACESARSSINLVDITHSFEPSFCWGIVYFPAAAAAVLFAHILAEPRSMQNRKDVQRIRQVKSFLSDLVSQQSGTYLDYVLEMCKRFELAAQWLVNFDKDRDSGESLALNNVLHEGQQQRNSVLSGAPATPIRAQQTEGQNGSFAFPDAGVFSGPGRSMDLWTMPYGDCFADFSPMFHDQLLFPPLPAPGPASSHQAPFPWSPQHLQPFSSG